MRQIGVALLTFMADLFFLACRVLTCQAMPRAGAVLGAAVLGLMLTGCAPGAFTRSERSAPAAASDALQRALETAPAGGFQTLADSPWGAGVVVQFEAPYAAASGRWCRYLLVEPGTLAKPALACRRSERSSSWELVRLLQVDGRPVLRGSRSGSFATRTE